jgi:formate/nitrite transporter FocA (FNT family)
MITGVIGFGGFHHSIVGNIEVLELFLHNNYNFRLTSVSVFSHSGNAIGGAVVVGLFKYRIFESNMK